MALNANILLYDEPRKLNTKASEEYVHVRFSYPDVHKKWDGWVPVEYRRTGVSIPVEDHQALEDHLNRVYAQMHPSLYPEWVAEQDELWNATRSVETKEIFNILKDGRWHCQNCEISNANYTRRIQKIKEKGYTIATHLNYHCPICGKRRSTRLILLPIHRVELAGNGYETWSPALRNRIIRVLGSVDVYENTVSRNCLPDHKFSEIRWDDKTKSENPETMSDDEIRDKFQLLTNQRNQQKREVCRTCFQTGKRGVIYGIPYYYEGTENWDPAIPRKGKEAERGCIGCPWYDIAAWRRHLLNALKEAHK